MEKGDCEKVVILTDLQICTIINTKMRIFVLKFIHCVVGTKIATQIFKDGDVVEVDAEKGIVKKL